MYDFSYQNAARMVKKISPNLKAVFSIYFADEILVIG